MSKTNQIDMTEGPIFTKLLQFSIPLIFSSILQLVFNAADVVVVGRFAGDNSLAAVGSTGSLINCLINLFTGLSVGTNVVAAHYYGSKDKKSIHDTVHTAILLSIYSGIILTFVGIAFTRQILIFMQSPDGVLDLAALYLKIYFGGIMSTMVYNFGSALLRAKGDTKRPVYILLSAGVINLILNLVFVICFKMGVAGVGIATVISQTISAVLVILILVHEQEEFHLSLKDLKINRGILIQIIKVGLPAGFQGIMFSFSNIIIQSSVNSFGALFVAGNSAACNLEGFVYTSMNGFSQGALTFTSQNMGAGKINRIKRVTVISQLSVFVVGLVLSSIFILCRRPLFGIFTKNPEVVDMAMTRCWIIFSTYYLCGMMDSMANTIRGMGHSLSPVITTLIGVCVFRLLWLFTFFQIPRFHVPATIFVSYPISWLFTFIALMVHYIRILKKNSSL